MASIQETGNKAASNRFHAATNTGDAAVISRTVDEIFEPDALIRTPVPVQATGAEAVKEGHVPDPGPEPRPAHAPEGPRESRRDARAEFGD
jgi:hypothetical protein